MNKDIYPPGDREVLKTPGNIQMNPGHFRQIILSLIVLLIFPLYSVGFVNDLRANGYSLIPAPQKVELSGKDIIIDNSWTVETQLGAEDSALKRLNSGAKELFGLEFSGKSKNKIILEINPGIIDGKIADELATQGYRLEIHSGSIKITGNAEAGLFYGVQSFLQLLRPDRTSCYSLPEGVITDWPDLELRFIHWDTKHHQDRIETLKRYLDQAAFFKVNAVGFEIEDKYEYPSHPIIGAPGAFTKTEMQELTAYALERFIQLVPVVQAPSHMAYVLKHKEFAHLKADSSSNYHICMCDEEAMQLIFDMYQDMIDATPGVDYFFVSTDEVYYAGICDKCKLEYNDVNRSQAWVNYVNRVHEWMTKRNRKMLAWVEYPLLAEDITKLPAGLIDAIMVTARSKEWINNENKAGIKQLAYSSMQGAEFLFPNYFPGVHLKGRLSEASENVASVEEKGAKPMGTFAAAWDDAGLHNEMFWLGWVTVTQYGWTSHKPTVEQSIADFMDVFYGKGSSFMVDVYKALAEGARFYENVWDSKISIERGPSYGNSKGKGIGTERYDLSLDMPVLPSVTDLNRTSDFKSKYASKIEKASQLFQQNEQLISQLMFATTQVSRNRYNLEVMLSLAYLERFTINTIINLAKVEDYLAKASQISNDPSNSVKQLVEAYQLTEQILKEQDAMWNQFTATWGKSQFEKCRSVNGKDFVHIMDDVKDHFADRRLGLEYIIAPIERMHIKEWNAQLAGIIKKYANGHNVKVEGAEIKRLED